MRECLWHPSKQVIALVLVAIALWAVPFLLLSLRVVLFAPLRVEKNALLRAVVNRSLKCQSESQSVESEALSARLRQLYFKIIIYVNVIDIRIFDIYSILLFLLLSLCTLASVHTQT